MTDPFAEVVALLQPSLAGSKATSGAGSWRVSSASGMAGPFFALLLEGAGRISMAGGDPIALAPDDFFLAPATQQFSFESADGGPPGHADSPMVRLADGEVRHGDGAAPANMRALVGRLAFGSPDAAMLLALLPRQIHVRGQKRLGTLVQLIRAEALAAQPARDMVLERLLEVLLIEALRAVPDEAGTPGLLRGLADPRLAAALRAMHAQSERDWSVEELAGVAALSRSVFFERFRRAVGLSPMAYLLAWRMAQAKRLLLRHEGGIKEIAQRVGYGSASAFSVAFTRFVGVPPTHYAQGGAAQTPLQAAS